MCEYTFGPRTKESACPQYGDDLPIYRHLWIEGGCILRTHRTVRVSPAGWCVAVVLNGGSHFLGYADTQKKALQMGAHMLSGPCGYAPRHREEGFRAKASEPTEYVGTHRAEKSPPRWAA